jgi:GT2 family glycosyltransferase
VIVPGYRNPEHLARCTQALKEQTTPPLWDVEDDSQTGFGFTKTLNNALRKYAKQDHDDDFVILLNQDCYLKPDAIEKMVAFMDAHPRCAIAGIKQLSSENEDVIIHGGTLECFPAGRHVGGLVSRGDCAVSKQVPWVNGACMIVRLEAVLEFGLMDENMKMFGSDADWSYTARSRGWECWYIADAVCVHEQGVSKERSPEMDKTFEKDMIYFRDKWISGELYKDLALEIFTP